MHPKKALLHYIYWKKEVFSRCGRVFVGLENCISQRSQMRGPLDHWGPIGNDYSIRHTRIAQLQKALKPEYFFWALHMYVRAANSILSKIAKISTSDKKLKTIFMHPDKSEKQPEEICTKLICISGILCSVLLWTKSEGWELYRFLQSAFLICQYA